MAARFTRKDKELVALLVDLNVPKNIAKILVFFSKRSSGRCKDFKKFADLRQPEVSMAMQEMRDRGWVHTETVNREMKGRPINSYTLAVPFPKILRTVIKEEQIRIREKKTNISRLRRYM